MTAPVGGPTTAQLLQQDHAQCFTVGDGLMCPVGSTTSLSSAPGEFVVNHSVNGYVTYHYYVGGMTQWVTS